MTGEQDKAGDPRTASGTVDPDEVARFNKLAETWWDERGPMRPLHRFNPVRVAFVRDLATNRFGRDADADAPLAGLSLLDIGCGGGVLSEPLARLGASVTGLDPAEKNLAVARGHAVGQGLDIDYRPETVEALAARGETFDIVLAMEVVEHVADVDAFVAAACAVVKPGGVLVMATLNRTLKSFALAIVGAEYVLRWLPRGTHDWHKFITPDELAGAITRNGLAITERAGVVYHPLQDEWRRSGDLSVNYILAAARS
ncbi:bifunctional 2-polyprenyl-6-hydroxyphenol methylase/3-demethylubiquinol 3-O-methyltransferase UbiG [Pseudochelatococcus contaminans]|uniref:Ubiquinone biosynthesis O-methyltransferase n=1 Tax=Pseudochelatococcus contaminans TaxID=1538103 RepID=A0A7W6EGY5_9HYPH|nr:bifunctional 2-polyprenyl-6-hydroxyphenol methylase/3-demethylubiquinol 3-O-methyltransferase UbiG [Pseudochelatococcus contaminans]MBB3809779.1 2-polyprenyl-6-hydroxyphenyl methylase/3-demethylubiquinone-9 3-methyltransferase [Pseudochelatococcus contaminans]